MPLRPKSAKPLTQALLRWYRRHKRDLPWRRTRDPYRIWISEVMLQQTRVSVVIPYYEQFLERFPTLESLAEARESDLLQAWSGLGYYRRARQMQAAARQIVSEHRGRFPSTPSGLRALPGIGDYTAAALASISFGQRVAVLDGNVVRVLTRLLDEGRDAARAAVRSGLQKQAQALIETAGPRSAGIFNQAIMELGATLCTPRNPQCLICPVADYCRARKNGTQLERPVKKPKQDPETLELAVALVRRGSRRLMRQRPADSEIMPDFWELPQAQAPKLDAGCFDGLGIELQERLGGFRHGITFRTYDGSVYRARLSGSAPQGYRWVGSSTLKTLPVTTITRKALRAARESIPS